MAQAIGGLKIRLFKRGAFAAQTDPFELKIRQAIELKWKKTREVTKDGGGAPFTRRCVRFARRREEAVLWHKDAKITLVRLNLQFKFDDFMELQGFLAQYPRNADLDDATGELKYRREIELFFVRHGYQENLSHIQATDHKFFVAFQKLLEAGFAAGIASVAVAGFVLHIVHQFYEQDRERSIRWLTQRADDFNSGRTRAA